MFVGTGMGMDGGAAIGDREETDSDETALDGKDSRTVKELL